MIEWTKRKLGRQAAIIVAGGLALPGIAVVLLHSLGTLRWVYLDAFLIGAATVIVISGIVSFILVTKLVSARLQQLIDVIDGTAPNDFLARIERLGDDEIAQVGDSVNRLLTRVTKLNASYIDQQRQLEATQKELKLKEELAATNDELEQRLNERGVLFDVLRVATSNTELEAVLHTVAQRAGEVLRFREVAVFIREDEKFVLRAGHGFPDESLLLGRELAPGEGVAGAVGQSLRPRLISDVHEAQEYLGFWGEAQRDGALVSVPIVYDDELLGVLSATRPDGDPVSDVELKLVCAIADQAALAIRNAQLFERTRDLATHDELTGLANRRLFTNHLRMEADQARRFQKPLSIVAIDIDHFKELNDRHGHPTGDSALRGVAYVLTSSVRKVDTVARVGGEELTVILPNTELKEAARVAEKLRADVAGTDLPGGAEQPHGSLTVSLGVAQLLTEDNETLESLIDRADRALYEAKRGGRNRVAVAQGEANGFKTVAEE